MASTSCSKPSIRYSTKRDYARAETFWSPKHIQHSSHIEPGREALFNLVKSIPATLKYEPGLIVADGDFERFTRHQFAFLDTVDLRKVGMSQRRENFGFAFKPCETLRVLSKGSR
jgi:hypothetical protein